MMEFSNIDRLTSEEKKDLLQQLLKKKSQKKGVHHLFEEQVMKTPNETAIITGRGNLTYSNLNKQANQVAQFLIKRGVKPGSRIGIYTDGSKIFPCGVITGVLGILKAGSAYVPLTNLYPGEYLSAILKKSKISLVLNTGGDCGFIADMNIEVIPLEDHQSLMEQADVNLDIDFTDDSFVCIYHYYQKEIALSHYGVKKRLEWLQSAFPLTVSDVVLYRKPPVVESSIREMFWPLLCGAGILIPPREIDNCVDRIKKIISENHVSVIELSPEEIIQFNNLTTEIPGGVDSLRYVFYNGKMSLIPKLHCSLVQYYSLPETAGEFAYSIKNMDDQNTESSCFSPAFQPVDVSNEQMNSVPIGGRGKLYADCNGLARVLADKGWENHEGTFRDTGLSARPLNNSEFIIESRVRKLEIEGFYVDLNEIEQVLLSEPSILECTVLVKEKGDQVPFLIAFVTVKDSFAESVFIANLKEKLPFYMLPDAFVRLKTFSLTDQGIIDFETLQKMEVIEPDLIKRWEERIRMVPGIDRVAILVDNHNEKPPLLHISDLIPGWKPITEEKAGQSFLNSPEFPKKVATNNILSLVDGGDLEENNLPPNLLEIIQRAAKESPENGVVYLEANGRETFLSYQRLLLESEQILFSLQKAGFKPGDKIIFQLEQNQDFIPAFWACILGGMIPVPLAVISSADPNNSMVSRLLNVWEMLEKPEILTSDGADKFFRALADDLGDAEFQVLQIDSLRQSEASKEYHHSKPEDLVLLVLTSGSTGMPKAVMLTHYNLLARSAGSKQMNGFSKDDRSLNWMPLDHVGGIIYFHIRDVYLGCKQYHAPTKTVLQVPLQWLEWVNRYQITITWAPNFAYALVNSYEEEIRNKNWDLSSLKHILNGGELIVAKTAVKFLELLKPFGLPATAMRPVYGMSETSSGIIYSSSFTSDKYKEKPDLVEVGVPIPGDGIRIVNEQNQVVAEKIIGTLHIKGRTVTPGYYRNPQANEEAFTKDGWFNTGDLGYIFDGKLTITGRAKEVIIINGINYYCHEIESVADEVDGVAPSFTAACAARNYDDNTEQLMIFFHGESGKEQHLAEVIKKIRTRVLNNVGINPEYIIPLPEEAIPKTSIGKIRRIQLKKSFVNGEFNEVIKKFDLLLENKNTMIDWFFRKDWRPKTILTTVPYFNQNSLIFMDRTGLGAALREKLNLFQCPMILVEPGEAFCKHNLYRYGINPKNAGDYELLMNSIAADGIEVQRIFYLNAFNSNNVTTVHDLETAQYDGCFGLLYLIRALAKSRKDHQKVNLYVISSSAQAVLPGDQIDFEKSTLTGFLKTIPLELSWLEYRHLDLEKEDPDLNIQYILAELNCPAKETEVAYRRGRRYISGLAKVNLFHGPKREIPITPKGIYLITGGLGGIGTYLCKYLIKNYQTRLIIAGRTPLPPGPIGPDTWRKILRRLQKFIVTLKSSRLGRRLSIRLLILPIMTNYSSWSRKRRQSGNSLWRAFFTWRERET